MIIRSKQGISLSGNPTLFRALFFIVLCWFTFFLSAKLLAEKPAIDDYKAVIIHKVIQLTTWPNEHKLSSFEIGVYGGSSSYISNLNKNYRNRNIRGKSLHVSAFNPFRDTKKISVLFVKDRKSHKIADISQVLKGKNILVISDLSKDKRHVMVNLTRPSKQEIGFEINRSNIILEGLKISKDVILAGGSELDVAKIYKETATDLTKTKKILTDRETKLEEQSKLLQEQNNELSKQSKEINDKSSKLVKLEVELNKQLNTIKESSNILKGIENKLKTSKKSLGKQESENTTLTEKIRENIRILEEQKIILKLKDTELEIKDAELEGKDAELEVKYSELEGKEAELNIIGKTVSQQEVTIATQKELILAISFAVLLISLLGLISYRGYVEKKRTALVIEEKNTALEKAIVDLNLAQEHLIESEKMASLGGMVSGIAHEVNTPAGIVLTADSSLLEKTLETKKLFNNGSLTQKQFSDYLDHTIDCTELSLSNIRRIASIVQTFKQVAVDHSSNEQRRFSLSEYVEDVVNSLRPMLKQKNHQIHISCPKNIMLFSYPGAFAQIFSILISNSLDHGFKGIEKGEINLNFSEKDDNLLFSYEDNGIGASDEVINRIFDPFYTTKRGEGNSGLGTHILYNLVTQLLKGKVKCKPGKVRGLNFELIIPEKLAAS